VGNPMISKRVAMMWLAILRAYAVRYLHPNLAAAQIARGKRTNTNLPISTIADALGLNDPAYFSRLFSGATGLSPRRFATNSIVGREQWLS
jgi:AraC-like DNA-binding protein